MNIKRRYIVYIFAVLLIAIIIIPGIAETNEIFSNPVKEIIIYTALIVGAVIEAFEFIAKRDKRLERFKKSLFKRARIDYETEKAEMGVSHLFAIKKQVYVAVERRCKKILQNDIIEALSANNNIENAKNYNIQVPFTYYENLLAYRQARNSVKNTEATKKQKSYRPSLKENNLGVIVLGEPGNGKTLYTANWLLDELKQINKDNKEELINSKIPVFISLGAADFTNFDDDNFDEWLGETFYRQYEHDGFSKPDLIELSKKREFVPFFDGLDEVTGSAQFHCFKCLHNYAGKRNSSIFSCRSYDFESLLEKYGEDEKKRC